MLKLRFVLASTVIAAIAAPSARADEGTLPNGATLTFNRMFIHDDPTDPGSGLDEPPDPETLRHRLSAAGCACSLAGATGTNLFYEVQLSTETGTSTPGQVWVGSECQDDLQRDMLCRKVDDIGDLDDFAVQARNIEVGLFDLINASSTDVTKTECNQVDNGQAFVWINADTDNNGALDFFSAHPIDLDLFPNDVSGFDTKPPPLPMSLRATGGEESIEIAFDPPESREQDVFGYHAFCMDPDGNPVTMSPPKPLFVTTRDICNIPPTELIFEPSVITGDGSPVDAAPTEFTSLDPAYLCARVDSSTAQSVTIEGLENNVEYKVALVAVDFYGNATGTFFTETVVPKPVTDFWEDLHDRGSKVEGGFCAAGGGSGSAGSLVLVVAVAWLARRRRRREATPRSALACVPVVLAAVLAPGLARADEFAPYWEDPGSEDGESGVATFEPSKWHAGIKLGPYVPAIDDQAGRNMVTGMGPYQAMFGNYYVVSPSGEIVGKDAHVYQILPVLDVDRFLWSESGQFGVGGSLGYMQKSALPYLSEFDFGDGRGPVPTSPDDPRRPRSRAGSNTFRLIPVALTVTYRATQLDDLLGIPIVPYVRGGLSYYVWWLKGPGGEVSKVCKDGSMTDGCSANKAYGGSLGLQGSLGIAVRAERIDPAAARSMVQSGIYHAGFYAELMYAKVDGFGSDTKLSVGDKTWFAGVDFEF